MIVLYLERTTSETESFEKVRSTMAALRRIKLSLFLMLLLPFTGKDTSNKYSIKNTNYIRLFMLLLCVGNIFWGNFILEPKTWQKLVSVCLQKDIFPTIFHFFQFSSTPDAAVHRPSYITVKVGDGVTLPCGYVKRGQTDCDRTTWSFRRSGDAVKWFDRGNFTQEAKTVSDSLSVAAKCSLVIKKVRAENAGLYACSQAMPGYLSESEDYLSVVNGAFFHIFCLNLLD